MSKRKPRRSPRGGCTVAGRFYKGGQFLPKLGTIITGRKVVVNDERAIAAELSLLTVGDEVYREAMHKTLKGSKAVRPKQVLKSRRLQAISRLVERAEFEGDYQARARLHDLHQRTLQGVLALAGN